MAWHEKEKEEPVLYLRCYVPSDTYSSSLFKTNNKFLSVPQSWQTCVILMRIINTSETCIEMDAIMNIHERSCFKTHLPAY